MNGDQCRLLNEALQQQLQAASTLAQAVALCGEGPHPAGPDGEAHHEGKPEQPKPGQPPKK